MNKGFRAQGLGFIRGPNMDPMYFNPHHNDCPRGPFLFRNFLWPQMRGTGIVWFRYEF